MIFNILGGFILIAYILNQVGRIPVADVAVTVLDIAVGLSSVCFLFSQRQNLHKIFWKDAIGRAWIYFILAALFSLTANIRYLSGMAFFISSLYLLRWICYSLLFFAIKQLDRTHKQRIIVYMLIAGGVIVFSGLLQYALYPNLRNLYYLGWDEHMYRLFSVFLDPNFAGAFFVLLILFLLGMLFRHAHVSLLQEGMLKKILLIISVIALALTFSRSALIMFLSSLFVLFLLEQKQKIMIPILIGLGVFILSISQFFYIENINLFRTASSQERLVTAASTLKIISQQPIFGVGFNAFKYAQIRMGLRQANPPIVSHADNSTDNSFLFILATTGIVGLYFYGYFWFRIIQSLLNKSDTKFSLFTTISFASLIGVFIDSLFINSLFYPSIMLWLWCVLGLSDYK